MLIKETLVYKVSTEQEADSLIEKFTNDQSNYKLTKSEKVYKTKKSKGEIIDEWYIVTITKNYEE